MQAEAYCSLALLSLIAVWVVVLEVWAETLLGLGLSVAA